MPDDFPIRVTCSFGEKKLEAWWRSKAGPYGVLNEGVGASPSHRFGYIGFACGFLLAIVANGVLSVAIGGGSAGFWLGAVIGNIATAAGYMIGDSFDAKRDSAWMGT